MIETTLGELAAAEEALREILEVKLPASVAYRIARLTRSVEPEVRHFFERRNALVRELGEARPLSETEAAAGTPLTIQVPPERMSTFLDRVNELAAVPVTIPEDPISVAVLGDAAISPGALIALGPLLVA